MTSSSWAGRLRAARWRRFITLALVGSYVLFAFAGALTTVHGSDRHVDVIRLANDINPITADFVERGLNQANSDGAAAVVIELDTPGGELDSMVQIIEHMYQSGVPTVVYVYPGGAWAGSAGTFITMAADVAAMAPGTTIGAASPVGSTGQDLGKTEKKKVTNFAAGYIRALAVDHHHNSTFAVRAVRGAKAIGYREAVKEHVVNLSAPNITALLHELNGKHVAAPSCAPQFGGGSTSCTSHNGSIVFHTGNASVSYIDMDLSENLLLLITNPNLVLVLMSVGTLAIIFELSSPGAILPGIVGVICLAIAFYAIGVIPVNGAGFVLLAFAILLFIADVKMPTHGFLTVGGIIAFVLGALLLFSPSGASGPGISPWVVAAVALGMGAFFGFVVTKAVRARAWPHKTGPESLVGTMALTLTRIDPDGLVFLDGARWRAVSETGAIDPNVEVRVNGIEGLTARVSAV
jgi:membrane-bound serine protease (ClpP class)